MWMIGMRKSGVVFSSLSLATHIDFIFIRYIFSRFTFAWLTFGWWLNQAWYYTTHRGWSTYQSLLLHTINYSISLLFHIFFQVRKHFLLIMLFCWIFLCMFVYSTSTHSIFARFFEYFFCHRIGNTRKKSKRKISCCPKLILH